MTELLDLNWRRSTRCSTGACVAVATTPSTVLVRDDKDPTSPVLTFEPAAWRAFIAHLRG